MLPSYIFEGYLQPLLTMRSTIMVSKVGCRGQSEICLHIPWVTIDVEVQRHVVDRSIPKESGCVCYWWSSLHADLAKTLSVNVLWKTLFCCLSFIWILWWCTWILCLLWPQGKVGSLVCIQPNLWKIACQWVVSWPEWIYMPYISFRHSVPEYGHRTLDKSYNGIYQEQGNCIIKN